VSSRAVSAAAEYIAILGYSPKVFAILEELDQMVAAGSIVYLLMGACRTTGTYPSALKNVTLQFIDGDATSVDAILDLIKVSRCNASLQADS
jgi:hypothetical protein